MISRENNKRIYIANFNIASILQTICQHVVELVLWKFTCSRNGWTPTRILFPRMDAHQDCEYFIIRDHWSYVEELSLVVRLRVWFVNVLLTFKISTYIDNMYLAFNSWMRNVSTHNQFDCIIVFSTFE